MPPKNKFTKEQIINASIKLISQEGEQALSARNLAKSLNSSSKVIFGLFKNMDDLLESVYEEMLSNFYLKLGDALKDESKPGYLTVGLAYIRYAMDNTNIFKALIYSKRKPRPQISGSYLDMIFKIISEKSHVSIKEAEDIHLKYWIFMHGVVDLIINSNFKLSIEQIEEMLEENYNNLVKSTKEKRKD